MRGQRPGHPLQQPPPTHSPQHPPPWGCLTAALPPAPSGCRWVRGLQPLDTVPCPVLPVPCPSGGGCSQPPTLPCSRLPPCPIHEGAEGTRVSQGKALAELGARGGGTVGGLTPAGSSAPPSPQQDGQKGENGGRGVCERKDVTSKSPAKQSQTSRPHGRGRRVMPPPGQPHPSHPAVTGGGKCHHPMSPLPFPPRRSVRSGVSCGWDVPWSAGASRAPLAAGSLAGGVRPWRWAGAAQRWRERDISCSRHKAKALPAPAEKVNSVPAKTGTSTRGGDAGEPRVGVLR